MSEQERTGTNRNEQERTGANRVFKHERTGAYMSDANRSEQERTGAYRSEQKRT